MRLYALYHGSKKLLVFMIVAFIAEIGSIAWILISENLANYGTISIDHISYFGYGEIDVCNASTSAVFTYIWVPCLVFEATLCLFSIYAGFKHSRGRSRRQSGQSNRPRLIDVLIQGNVIYFFSPLAMFILYVINPVNTKIQWLANILFFRAPITILAGCRLILSIREAASPPSSYESVTDFAHSTLVFGARGDLSQA
ncbi:hypothetical protein V8B97DRAFT_10438 [Scleroderma yunnanense]